jgi:prolyl oligopeptidase
MSRWSRIWLGLSSLGWVVACSAPMLEPAPVPVPAPPVAAVATAVPRWQAPLSAMGTQTDDYHGEQIADPYRWLEQDGSDTQAWIAAQNALTQKFLAAAPSRLALRARLEQVWNYPKVSPPLQRGGRLFWRRNDGLQNQPVLCWSGAAEAMAAMPSCRTLLDPNTLASDGTVALQSWMPSPDGRKLAYALAEAGSDWTTIGVRDVDSGRDLTDRLEWVKFSAIVWHPDG